MTTLASPTGSNPVRWTIATRSNPHFSRISSATRSIIFLSGRGVGFVIERAHRAPSAVIAHDAGEGDDCARAGVLDCLLGFTWIEGIAGDAEQSSFVRAAAHRGNEDDLIAIAKAVIGFDVFLIRHHHHRRFQRSEAGICRSKLVVERADRGAGSNFSNFARLPDGFPNQGEMAERDPHSGYPLFITDIALRADRPAHSGLVRVYARTNVDPWQGDEG